MLCLHELAVHQHIQQAQQLVGGFTPGKTWLFAGQLFPGVAGIAPYRFVRVQGLEVAHEGQQLPLIFRLHGFAAQQRKTRDIVRLAGCKHFVAGGFVEGLAIVKVPRHGVEAPRAVVAAAGHEHAGAHPRAVGNVIVFDGCVVHNMIPVLYKEMEACRCGPSGENTFGAARRPLQT